MRSPRARAAGLRTASAVHGVSPGARIGLQTVRARKRSRRRERMVTSVSRSGFEKMAPMRQPSTKKENSNATMFATMARVIELGHLYNSIAPPLDGRNAQAQECIVV